MGWVELTAAFAVFFLSHALPVRPPLRPWLVSWLGARGFTFAYSALSVAVLAWLIQAAGRAPFVPLWPWALWRAHLAVAIMAGVCVILALTLGRPNPFSFGGARNDRFDPRHPGMVRWVRHPVLLALALWAAAHGIANGDLAHVILFALFGGFALIGGRIVDRRKQREMGDRWQALWQATRSGPVPLRVSPGLMLRLCAGGALFAVLLALHPVVIGVPPLP